MFNFCFNDSIPQTETNDVLVQHLSTTLTHYNDIKRKFPTVVDGVITDRLPENVILNKNNFSLKDCIKHLERNLQRVALSIFNKYPVDNFYDKVEIDKLVENEYVIVIDKIAIDATNAKIIEENEGVLFTIPIHVDLKKDYLTILDKSNAAYKAVNLYGHGPNSDFISKLIQSDLIRRAGGFEKLLVIIGDCHHDERFRKNFESFPASCQEFLLKEVERAINRNLKTRFWPDDELIKDVTPNKERDISVFELRIHRPVAIRLYLYESKSRVYLGGICKKPKRRVQTNDINNAVSVIKELIALEAR